MGGVASFLVTIGFKIIGGVIDNFKEKRKKKEYERQMFDFHLQRRTLELERLKLENERKILELRLLKHYEEIAKREEENKRIEKEKEAIEKFRKTLDDEFYKNIFEIIERFDEQKEKWIYEIDQDIIMDKCKELTVELEKLFNKLYKSENIKEKINKKFLKIIKSTYSPKELKKMNYIVIGTSGVGKSTLINELCGERLAKEGNGKRITTVNKKYESNFFLFSAFLIQLEQKMEMDIN
jgi:signal recognition particle GTPase